MSGSEPEDSSSSAPASSPPPPQPPHGEVNRAGFSRLSVKGIPGVTQIPHPDDHRPLSWERAPGTFQLPDPAGLTEDEREEVDEIVRHRRTALKGVSTSGLPIQTYTGGVPRPGQRAIDSGEEDEGPEGDVADDDGHDDGDDDDNYDDHGDDEIVMAGDSDAGNGDSQTSADPRNLPEHLKPRMPAPTDPRARGHGRGSRYGHQLLRRGQGRAPRPQAQGDQQNINRRWENESLQRQHLLAIDRERTLPSPHQYRYICPERGCAVSANNVREISRHYNLSNPPLHPNMEHVPRRSLQGVLYRDWLRDEGLRSTRHATTTREFYVHLSQRVTGLDREMYQGFQGRRQQQQQQQQQQQAEQQDEEEEGEEGEDDEEEYAEAEE